MSTRAKFSCSSIEDYGQSKKINLGAVYEGSVGPNEENKRFTVATPWGQISLTVDNPAASIQFKPGREYYVVFTEAPPTQCTAHAYGLNAADHKWDANGHLINRVGR